MKKEWGIFLIFLFFISYGKAEDVFFLYVTVYKNDSVGLKTFEIMEGEKNVYPPGEGNYELKVISLEKEELFSGKFQITFQAFREWFDEKTGEMRGQLIELNEVEKLWRLPYFSQAEKIELYHQGKLIFSLNIPKRLCLRDGKCLDYCQDKGDPDCEIPAASTTTTLTTSTTSTLTTSSLFVSKCGNNVCDKEENYKLCPQDCLSGSQDNYCDRVSDKICDPDCQKNEDKDCQKRGFSLWPYLIIVIIVLLVGMVMAILFFKKREEKREKELREWLKKRKKYRKGGR